jgi:hypothetical protein
MAPTIIEGIDTRAERIHAVVVSPVSVNAAGWPHLSVGVLFLPVGRTSPSHLRWQ